MATKRRRKDRLAAYEATAYREIAEQLAANVRALRAERGWTQEQAAEHCDLPFQSYQPIEYAKTNFTAVTLSRLCDGFGVDASELLARKRRR